MKTGMVYFIESPIKMGVQSLNGIDTPFDNLT